jgi:hypothetical protein
LRSWKEEILYCTGRQIDQEDRFIGLPSRSRALDASYYSVQFKLVGVDSLLFDGGVRLPGKCVLIPREKLKGYFSGPNKAQNLLRALVKLHSSAPNNE